MQSIEKMLKTYSMYHEKTFTKLTHFIGIPMIIFAIQMILNWIHFPFFNNISFAWLSLISLLFFYFLLDRFLSFITALFLIPLTYFATYIAGTYFNWQAFSLFSVLFILGFILQLVGHYVEGKRPAFLENIFQIFIAPLFLIDELCTILGFKHQ